MPLSMPACTSSTSSPPGSAARRSAAEPASGCLFTVSRLVAEGALTASEAAAVGEEGADDRSHGVASRRLVLASSATQKKKPALTHFDRFLVTELQSKDSKAPKRDLWGRAHHTTTPHPGWGIPRGMNGGGPVDTAVTSPCPLLAAFIPRSPGFPRTHLGAVTSNGYKNKTAGS